MPYHFTYAVGPHYVMMAKEEMRKKAIKSPDLVGAKSVSFLQNFHYVPSDTAPNFMARPRLKWSTRSRRNSKPP